MKNRNKLLLKFLFTLFFSNIISGVGMLAQDGRWVAYSLDGIGSGANFHDCGDGVIGYAPANSQYVLIFDVRTGEWDPVDLGSTQTFNYLETQGNVLITRSENILFGYSSLLGVWDTVQYEGSVYMDLSNQLFQS